MSDDRKRAPNRAQWLMGRFAASVGNQAVAAKYGSQSADDGERRRHTAIVLDTWNRRLERFDGATIGAALDYWFTLGESFPPDLTRFETWCAQFADRARARHAEIENRKLGALPAPAQSSLSDMRPSQLAEIRSMLRTPPVQVASFRALSGDSLGWARAVGCMPAARALVDLAPRDHRVAEILAEHLEDDFARVRCADSRKWLRKQFAEVSA